MHDTFQLRDCCRRDPDIAPLFLGVFPADGLPARLPGECCFILNTDTSDKPGQHWVAGAKIGGKSYFFDSYGNRPSKYNEFWKVPLDSFIRSDRDLQQDNSTTCGDACLGFLKHITSGRSHQSFINQFDEDDDRQNDRMFRDFAHARWPRILNETSHDNIETAYDTDHLRRKRTRSNHPNQFGGMNMLSIMESLPCPLECFLANNVIQVSVPRK